jgi:hypothetical protein
MNIQPQKQCDEPVPLHLVVSHGTVFWNITGFCGPTCSKAKPEAIFL